MVFSDVTQPATPTFSGVVTIESVENIDTIQRRTLRLLFISQVAGGVGVAVGSAVGALLATDLANVGVSGLAQSSAVMGAALLAVPATRIVQRFGRGPSLAAAYLTAALGGCIIVAAAMTRSVPLLFAGFLLFGGGTTASMQARYAAVDLAPRDLYSRQLSLIVWATTVGGVLGPNLTSVAGTTLSRYGIPTLAAPFVFSSVLFTFVATLLFVGLRPDPLRVARGIARGDETTLKPTPALGMRVALAAVLANRDARLGVAAAAAGHIVMVGVMAMTPVHIRAGGHAPADTLRIVGVVLSMHIAGMYAFAPLMGWLADRLGGRQVILGGIAVLVAACAVAGTSGLDSARLAVGLVLLGLGWSATMVAGSSLLSQSMSVEFRPSAQGLSDLVMGIAGASAGALSGVVVQVSGYPTLTLVAALMTAPLAVLALTHRPAFSAPG
jgi:MFS family permease